MKLKYVPSIRVVRMPDEAAADFIDRVLKDPRLLPDQRQSLEIDRKQRTPFDDLVQAVWIEQAPVEVNACRD